MSVLWSSRKRLLLFGLPWTFTKYTLTDDKFLVDSGFFTSAQDEIRLYRIVDISMRRTLIQKMFKLGTIICDTVDKTCPRLELINVKNPTLVKELLSDSVEKERIKKRVTSREYMNSDDHFEEDDHDMDDADDNNY